MVYLAIVEDCRRAMNHVLALLRPYLPIRAVLMRFAEAWQSVTGQTEEMTVLKAGRPKDVHSR
jgi:hypothetical protein